MDKHISFQHKESGVNLPLDYIRANKEKDIIIAQDIYGMKRHKYLVKDIPTNEDWEVNIHYFTREEMNLLSNNPLLTRDLMDRIFNITRRNFNERYGIC